MAVEASHTKRGARPDMATIGGLLLAVCGVLGGLLLEGGNVMDLAQAKAAFIVLGGTIGAVMVGCPAAACTGAAKKLSKVFVRTDGDGREGLNLILQYAARARKAGLISLEADLDKIENPFLEKALALAVDGTGVKDIREIMHLEMDLAEQEGVSHARVFEAAGGYAPTVGIMGAVLGLIQVMKHLENIDEVGKGIAVAFVATIYGVGSANLLFLPAAAKLRALVLDEMKLNHMLLEGVCSIVEGMNPKMIAQKLEPFVRQDRRRREVNTARGNVARPAA
jgi:chemotaxis protein MotA